MSVKQYPALVLLLFVLTLFLGCAGTRPTPEQLAAADYGAYPDNYEEIIKSYMAERLFDPYSAQYEFLKGPTKMWDSWMGNAIYGYAVCAYVNAKNRFGGYVGRSLCYFLIRDGQVVRMCDGDNNSIWEKAKAEQSCEQFE